MIKKGTGKFTIFQSELFNNQEEIKHFFSSRNSGYEQLNLLIEELKMNHFKVIVPHQTHTDCIKIITESNKNGTFNNTDALITNEKGIVLIVKTADCVPILLFDKNKSVIAAVHSGWRGTSKNIVGKTVQLMKDSFSCNSSDIIASIGPCIGTNQYEVGSEVIEEFSSLFPYLNSIFVVDEKTNCKGKLNLKEANRILLLRAGIISENIEVSELCTYSNSAHFYSARRDGAKTGRMVNGIVLK